MKVPMIVEEEKTQTQHDRPTWNSSLVIVDSRVHASHRHSTHY